MDSRTIRFDRNVTGDIARATSYEWLETNGLGGFAASTIVGLNTRRYHGLLVAATKPPVERVVLLSKFEEVLIVRGIQYDLSANRYPGVVHPQGYRYLQEFRLDPFPIFTYEVDDIRIEKRVFMVHGENTTVVEYELLSGEECNLEIHPLIAFRDYHSTTHRNEQLNTNVVVTPGMAAITPYLGLPTLYISHTGAQITPAGDWYENFEYPEEQNRGLDYREDLFNPFVARFVLHQRGVAHLIAGLDPRPVADAPRLREREIDRRNQVVATVPSQIPFVQELTAAADQFIVSRGELKTIIAGYHWFGDWGRDTMIALPGLTLVTGRADVAKSILLAFAASLDTGMLPNRFPDSGETPEYNTVDATLWFFEAVRSLLRYTGDASFVHQHIYTHLKNVIDWHLRGTRYGIQVDSDGLLRAGEPGVQLTWMDSKIGDWVVTPRHGKPVEIQALWYNALRIMEDLARLFDDAAMEEICRQLGDSARDSFNRQFWNSSEGCLFDVVDGSNADASLRPNQIFAVSLANTMLSSDRAAAVVQVVERELLTPMGLRSLSPRDPRYRSRYEGGVSDRDAAYHQGTVWPWLMGPFITAYVRVHQGSDSARASAAGWLAGFEEHLRTTGLGQVSELADADFPHQPKGCTAQAWSVAELLRSAVEDVFVTKVMSARASKLGSPSYSSAICR